MIMLITSGQNRIELMRNITNVPSLIRTISLGMEGCKKSSRTRSMLEKIIIYWMVYLLGFTSGMLYCLVKTI